MEKHVAHFEGTTVDDRVIINEYSDGTNIHLHIQLMPLGAAVFNNPDNPHMQVKAETCLNSCCITKLEYANAVGEKTDWQIADLHLKTITQDVKKMLARISNAIYSVYSRKNLITTSDQVTTMAFIEGTAVVP